MKETKEVQEQRELLNVKYRRAIPMAEEIWHHFKDNAYKIIACPVIHTETREIYCVYQALYGSYGIYCRPKKSGVCVTDMSRSQMFANIMVLLDEKVITLEDLEGFSDSLRERLELLHR